MTSDDLEDKVKKIIAERLRTPEDKITAASRFVDDLGADSLDQVELIMALEESFGCEIPDGDAAKLQTVGQAVDYIKNLKK